MINTTATVLYDLLMDFVSGGMNDNVPKETPSPSPVPNWDQPPEAPEIIYNWVDVTEEFDKACGELNLGELVHETHFGLFEAMSAIEMMDPKMDVGMVGKHAKRQVLTFKQSVDENRIKLKDLSPQELIVIMDTCQACILSWIEGQSLAQTVFTCLYLHEPDMIEDRCLRAYCLGVLKACDMIKDKIYKANVFEEEDFQTLTYGFKFASNVTDLRVVGMLKETEDDVNRAIRMLKSRENNESDPEEKEVLSLKAVLARTKFLRLFLQALMPFGKKEMDAVRATSKFLIQMTENLQVIDKTVHLGVEPTVTEDGHEIAIGFEPLVNQRLLPPTFPRYTKLRKRTDIFSSYNELIKRIQSILDFSAYTSFHSILDFVVNMAHRSPCVLTRSLLQIVFVPENRKVFGSHLLADALKDSLRSFDAPPSLSPRFPVLYNNTKAKDALDAFMTKATRVISKLVQAYGHNYARQREKLAAMLEELSALQDDADRCDADLHAILHAVDPGSSRSHLTCLGSWTLYHTLRVMTQYVLSGFELELYSEHEYHYIYWYLAEILLSWQITTLNRANGQLHRDETFAEQMPSKSRSHKKAKKNKKKTRVHALELVMTQGMQILAAGCFKALLGFFMDGKLKTPDFVFDNEGTRYEHRFAPFITVATPPFIHYKQFREMTDVSLYNPTPTSHDLYLSSSKHFAQAKLLYEKQPATEEIQQLLLVAKTNMIVTKLLAGGHKKQSTAKPDFDFSVHSIFPIIRVT